MLGIIPQSFCLMTHLTALYFWYTGGSTNNPYITCTLSCLSSKTGMSYTPVGLPQCPSTAVPAATQTALCDIVAATNISSISGYSAWQCTAAHSVVTQPCNGGTAVWTGISGCSSSGDVTSIDLHGIGLSGKDRCMRRCC